METDRRELINDWLKLYDNRFYWIFDRDCRYNPTVGRYIFQSIQTQPFDGNIVKDGQLARKECARFLFELTDP